MDIIKAEILFTRKCNLKCGYCNMVDNTMKELSIDDWKKGIEALNNLGVEFFAIYGAEPLINFNRLINFLNILKGFNIEKTVITNGILLDEDKIIKLKKSGLNSITMSYDIMGIDKDTQLKTSRFVQLKSMLERHFKDIEIVITINPINYKKLPDVIKKYGKKYWIHFDPIHYDRGQPGSKCYLKKPDCVDYASDFPEVFKEVLNLKNKGYKIHPTPDIINDFIFRSDIVTEAKYRCKGTSWLTIDADGTVYFCDDFKPEEFRSEYNVMDIDKNIKKFQTEAQNKVKNCPGCYWVTHVMSDRMVGTKDGLNYFKHEG